MSDIAERCAAVAEAAAAAEEWLEQPSTAELVGAERKSIRRELRRGAMRARKLARAAKRPMCVSVFGPSQAGKSFLVSVLARPEEGRLVSDFPDPNGRLDFIREINPEGEGESTGLVTRFTIRRYDAPAGFPVKLRLLSEGDIARILANTFMMDGDKTEDEPTREELDRLFGSLRGRAAASAGGVSIDDVVETQEYMVKAFGRSSYVAALSGFWEEAAELAPRLSVADRAMLFAPLWGRHDAFTKLYARLASALAALGGADEAFAPLEALTPRETSIIDVKLLNGLDEEGGPTLMLVTPEGRRAELPKPVVTALTAELVMPMAESPHPLFAGTDLLDFPGARTRFEKPLGRFLMEASGPLKECVLRGKVAYLFDRYVAEQEITSMLLCIPDSNMEVADLPGLISDWIDHTHGATPEARTHQEKLLFFVLTKFDKHLIDSAGSGDDPRTRFERRMQASLLEKFSPMEDSWPKAWGPGRPFDNCFWLRNPNFPAESVIRYKAGREIGYVEDEEKQARLQELRAGCLAADLVRAHFDDPEGAWDAAMALNDGGVSHLVRRLEPVCRPEVKGRQVEAQLKETAARLARPLARHHVSDDVGRRLEERRAAAQAVMGALLHVFERRLFGALLDELTIRPAALAERFARPPASIRFVAAKPAASQAVVLPGAMGGAMAAGVGAGAGLGPSGAVPGVVLPGGGGVFPPPAASGDGGAPRTMTRSEWRAAAAFELWVETLKALAAAEDLPHRLALAPEAANEIVGELIAAARRLGLEAGIAAELEAGAFMERGDRGLLTAATLAAERINAFAMEAGAPLTPLEKRPDIAAEDGPRKPFASRRQTDEIDGLPATPRRRDAERLTDWMHMLYRLFEDNAKDSAGGVVDIEQNMRLGGVLAVLAAA